MSVAADETRPSPAVRVTQAAIRALWFGVIPLLLAVLTYRWGVPGPKSGYGGALGTWAAVWNERPTLALLTLFLIYAALARYWASALYGAELWHRPSESRSEPTSLRQVAQGGAWLLLAALLALAAREVLYRPYRVLSASMLPTLAPGEELLVNRHAYGFRLPFAHSAAGRLPARGDVIAFHKQLGPGMPEELVKRVVGLPGDSIVVRAGQLLINGWAAPSCDAGRYTYLSGSGMLDARLVVEFLGDASYLTAFFAAPDYGQQPYLVKPGEVFVLGDNRSNSADSRFWNEGQGGGLPLADISGRFERRLLGVARDGSANLASFMRPLGLDVSLPGIDTRDLQQGIDACLARRPKNTQPPPPATSGAQP